MMDSEGVASSHLVPYHPFVARVFIGSLGLALPYCDWSMYCLIVIDLCVSGCGVGSHGHERERHPRQHQERAWRDRGLVLDAHEVPVPEA